MDVLPGHGAMVSGTTRRLLLSLASYTAPPVSTFRIRRVVAGGRLGIVTLFVCA